MKVCEVIWNNLFSIEEPVQIWKLNPDVALGQMRERVGDAR